MIYYDIDYSFALYPERDNFINEIFPLRFRHPVILFVALPQIQKIPDWHEPHIGFASIQMRRSVI